MEPGREQWICTSKGLSSVTSVQGGGYLPIFQRVFLRECFKGILQTQ